MSRSTTTETRTTTHEVTVEIRCDLCGRAAPRPRDGRDVWASDGGAYTVCEPTVAMREGQAYPDGGETTATGFDVCPDCFRDRLIPWFHSQGAAPTITTLEW